ncbi:hypothetical protein GBA52_026688 [Prunus armeniaca]|nr:hypothetical protein GBA52_026688 [Prunus armeniaca]
MAFTAYSALSFKSLLHPEPIKHHPSLPQLPTHKPISAVHVADPSKPSGAPQPTFPTQPKWSLGSWRAKKALQLPEYSRSRRSWPRSSAPSRPSAHCVCWGRPGLLKRNWVRLPWDRPSFFRVVIARRASRNLMLTI